MQSNANFYLGSLSMVLYRDSDGFYNHLPPRAGFYLLTQSIGNQSISFFAIAKKGKYGALEFFAVSNGNWVNYSENIPQDAVVEFVAMDELQIDCFPRLAS
jgi:hypothetical protein